MALKVRGRGISLMTRLLCAALVTGALAASVSSPSAAVHAATVEEMYRTQATTSASRAYPQGLNAALAFAAPTMSPPSAGTQMWAPDSWQKQYNEFITGQDQATRDANDEIKNEIQRGEAQDQVDLARGLRDFDRELLLRTLYLWRTIGKLLPVSQDKQWKDEFLKRQTQWINDFSNRPRGSPPPPAAATPQEYQSWRNQIRRNWQTPPGSMGAQWYVVPGMETDNAKFWTGIFSGPGEYSYSD